MEAKLRHLDFLQSAIARMSNASFLFKGWSISVAGALFAFAVVNDKSALAGIAIASTLLFWGLDGYYLWLERGFVKLYNKVVIVDEDDIDFAMAIDKGRGFRTWLRTCFRPHLFLFYGVMLGIEIVGIFVVRRASCGA